MEYIKLSDRIEILNFSVRTNNCLRKSGINTIEDLLNYPKEKFALIRNMGNKSVQEVLNFIDAISIGEGSFKLIESDDYHKEVHTFIGEDGNVYEDIEINYDILPTRAVNSLKNNGYQYISEIINTTYDELMNLKNMGRTTVDSIYEYIINVQFKKTDDVLTLSEEEKENKQIANEISKYFNISTKDVLSIINDCLDVYPNAKAESLINVIYTNDKLKTKVKDFIIGNIKLNNEMDKDKILSLMPSNIHNTLILDGLLIELESENIIKIKDNFITVVYPSVIEYINKVYEGKKQEMLLERIQGLTLEEIGNKHSLTRERVRQIISKEIKKFPRTREEDYLYYIQHYDFSLEDFLLAFNEPEATYHYLTLFDRIEKKPLEEALEDDNIDENYKRKIEKAVYKQYVLINGVRIKKQRTELVKYYVRSYCKELVQYDDFIKSYKEFLIQYNLDESLMIEERTYENRLQEIDYVLWQYGKQFRYYNIVNMEMDEFLNELDLSQYNDIEISTLKIFRENETLMQRFDIRDEMELHNILKKIYKIKNLNGVTFGRMPMIVFGKADRDSQVFDLMIQYAPISWQDLSIKCEEVYGYKSGTVAAGHYFDCILEYYNNGMFKLDNEIISNEILNSFKKILVDDFYSLDKIKQLFTLHFPNEKQSVINTYSLRQLGFRIFTGYVVSDKFNSVTDYLDSLICSKDLSDLSGVDKYTLGNTLYAYILRNKKERTFVEYLPDKFISIRRLNENGITIADLKDYCNQAYKMIDKGEFFTIQSLRNKGFTHRLDEFGFDDYFYTSVLIEDERFSNRRMGNTKLLYCGNKTIQLLDLLTYLLEENRKFDLYDLVDYLKDEYGIKTDRDKIKQLIKDSDMYYDQIMDTVYIDYDTYFEEV